MTRGRRRPRSAALRTVVAVSISLVSCPHLGLVSFAASQLDVVFADDQSDVMTEPPPRLQEGSDAAHKGGKPVDAQQGMMPAFSTLSSDGRTDSAAVAAEVAEGDSEVEVHGSLLVQVEGVSGSGNDLEAHVYDNKRGHAEGGTCESGDESEEPMSDEDSVATRFPRKSTIRSATCSGTLLSTWNPYPIEGSQEEQPYTIVPSNEAFEAFSVRSATRSGVDTDMGGVCNAVDGSWILGQCRVTDGGFNSDRPADPSSDVSIEQQREAIKLGIPYTEDMTDGLDSMVEGQCEPTEAENEGGPTELTCRDETQVAKSQTYDSAGYEQSAADTEQGSESDGGKKRDLGEVPVAVVVEPVEEEVLYVADASEATAEALIDATSDLTATATEGQLGDIIGQPELRGHYGGIIPAAENAVFQGKDTAIEADVAAAGKLEAANPSATESPAEASSASRDAGASSTDEVPLGLSDVDKIVDDDDNESPLELWSRGFLERASDTEAEQSWSGDPEAGDGDTSSTTITVSNNDFEYEDSPALGVPPAQGRDEVRGPRMTGVGVAIPNEDVSSELGTSGRIEEGHGASADDVAATIVPVLTKQAQADVLAAQATLEAIMAEPKPNEKDHYATTDDVAAAKAPATASPNKVQTLTATHVGRDGGKPAPHSPTAVLMTPVKLVKDGNAWTKSPSLWLGFAPGWVAMALGLVGMCASLAIYWMAGSRIPRWVQNFRMDPRDGLASLDATIRARAGSFGSFLEHASGHSPGADGDESYADLPDLVSEKRPSSAAIGRRVGVPGAAAEMNRDGIEYCGEDSETEDDNAIWDTSTDRKPPERLVFDPVLGVVPLGVLLAWEKDRSPSPSRLSSQRLVGNEHRTVPLGKNESVKFGESEDGSSAVPTAAEARTARMVAGADGRMTSGTVAGAGAGGGSTAGVSFPGRGCDAAALPAEKLKRRSNGPTDRRKQKRPLPPVRGTPEWHAWQMRRKDAETPSLQTPPSTGECGGGGIGNSPPEKTARSEEPPELGGKDGAGGGRGVGAGAMVGSDGCCRKGEVARAVGVVGNGVSHRGKVSTPVAIALRGGSADRGASVSSGACNSISNGEANGGSSWSEDNKGRATARSTVCNSIDDLPNGNSSAKDNTCDDKRDHSKDGSGEVTPSSTKTTHAVTMTSSALLPKHSPGLPATGSAPKLRSVA